MGMLLRVYLPEHHQGAETQRIVNLGTRIIGTMEAHSTPRTAMAQFIDILDVGHRDARRADVVGSSEAKKADK